MVNSERFIFRKYDNHFRNKLPTEIEAALVSTKNHYITESISRIRDGQILYTSRRRRWRSADHSRFCRLEDDLLYFRYDIFGCRNAMIGRLGSKKVDLRHIRVLPPRQDGCPGLEDSSRGNYFTIAFNNSSRLPLNFITSDEESAKSWVRGLNHLKNRIASLQPRLQFELSVWELFNSSDLDKDGHVTSPEALKILFKNAYSTKQEITELLKTHCGSNPTLDFYEFFEAYKTASIRRDICELFKIISADKRSITARELYKFIQVTQKEKEITELRCEQIIFDFEFNEESRNERLMTIQGFHLYLTSKYGEIFNYRHDKVFQDMKRPLSHYFVASSHNTYLTGDQLTEPSSIDSYMNALLKGCRCVELDCWDGPDGEPVVYHGYTFTTKLKFKDVVEVIGRYAFEVSIFPLILSLENHCSLEQQNKMSYYLKKILGSELLTTPLLPSGKEYVLPSPSALRGKILLKGKVVGPDSALRHINESDDVFEVQRDVKNQRHQKVERRIAKARQGSWPWSQWSHSSTSRSSSAYSSANSSANSSVKQKFSPALSDLIVYCQSEKFQSFDISKNYNDSFRKMSSFSEKRARRLAKSQMAEAINYHRDKLSRTYPSGSRTDSSNYDPQPLWNAGFQLVALNYQTKCDEMEVYCGKFRQNGNCGYVLKPEYQRIITEPAIKPEPKLFKIRIISGQHLAGDVTCEERRKCCPLVEIIVSGTAEDATRRSTAYRENGDYVSSWNEDFLFYIGNPEVAMIRFILRDRSKNKDRVGQFTLPFTSILEGYRHVPFLNSNGTPLLKSCLFVQISLEDTDESIPT